MFDSNYMTWLIDRNIRIFYHIYEYHITKNEFRILELGCRESTFRSMEVNLSKKYWLYFDQNIKELSFLHIRNMSFPHYIPMSFTSIYFYFILLLFSPCLSEEHYVISWSSIDRAKPSMLSRPSHETHFPYHFSMQPIIYLFLFNRFRIMGFSYGSDFSSIRNSRTIDPIRFRSKSNQV